MSKPATNVEIIIVDGFSWRRYPNGNKSSAGSRYFMTTLGDKSPILGETFLHRYIWRKHNNEIPIPSTKLIHHVNGDRSDNRIENLECVDRKDHSHQASKLGVALMQDRKVIKPCLNCGKPISVMPHCKMVRCSVTCERLYKQKHLDIYGINKTCPDCGKIFRDLKTSRTIRCSDCIPIFHSKQAKVIYTNLWHKTAYKKAMKKAVKRALLNNWRELRKSGGKTFTCTRCNITFKAITFKPAKYCNDCKSIVRNEKQKGRKK